MDLYIWSAGRRNNQDAWEGRAALERATEGSICRWTEIVGDLPSGVDLFGRLIPISNAVYSIKSREQLWWQMHGNWRGKSRRGRAASFNCL